MKLSPLLNSSAMSSAITLAIAATLSLTSCTSESRRIKNKPQALIEPVAPKPTEIPAEEQPIIPFDYKTGEIGVKCSEILKITQAKIDEIKASASSEFKDTLLAYDAALTKLSDVSNKLTFMGYVSTNEELREEASKCESEVGQFYPTLGADKALYKALKKGVPASEEQKRLSSEVLLGFEKNGMNLDEASLAKLVELKQKLSDLQSKFSANLNEVKTTLTFTTDELKGLSEASLARFKKDDSGLHVVTLKSIDYVTVMENAIQPETRKKMLSAYLNRAADTNTKLLEEAILVRQEISKLLGYKTWAHSQIDGRMAQNPDKVMEFLMGLKAKLKEGNAKDLAKILARKQKDDTEAKSVEAFDVNYYANQIKKEELNLDDEKVAEYFPADHVMNGIFHIYSTLLGVEYAEVTNAKTWAEGVKLYEVRSIEEDKRIAYFYIDSIPRPGKYGHAAAFTITNGRLSEDGNYSVPVSSIVANFTPPSDGKPSLLGHDEVETLFHEFGHIMHQVLTRAPFGSLAGTAVAQDFVEAPSQMLENWVWNKEILNIISGHYSDTSQKLPDELLNQMLASKSFNRSYFYTRQLVFGLFDMSIHLADGAVDVTSTYQKIYEDTQGIKPLEGTHFPASFGHLMGGYDAGYYGYLWSEVYAQDMFTRFENEGLLSEKVGADYRKYILEQGSMKPAIELITEFLGREPNSDAFYKSLGL